MAVLSLIIVLGGVLAVAGAASWMVTGSLGSGRPAEPEERHDAG